ncbi:unnamed protein product [Symbiodinium natans]|uniref:Uncharacterized protein n=1 Tax=Symbiodinium natans TaxID=878477 RepID=A0A812TX47_9DINO|nr:unnamed protein product [Symbiodinium natans]
MPKVEGDGCLGACVEGDPSSIQTHESYKYVGEYQGEYTTNTEHVYVGNGRGDWEREVRTTYAGWKVRWYCMALLGALLFIALGWLLWWLWLRIPSQDQGHDQVETLNCYEGYHDWETLWDAQKQAACCDRYGRACPHFHVEHDVIHQQVPYPVSSPPHYHYVPVPMPSPPHVVYKTHYVHIPAPAPPPMPPMPPPAPVHHFAYNCRAGYSNWYFGWSHHKKVWCCHHTNRGCPGTWHGSYHLHMHVMHGVGHAHGRIYDCAAGFSNWMQGWSDSKKDWCCSHEHKGCVKYHCTGHAGQWDTAKSAWCCAHFQKGCPQTTLSPLKCETPCEIQGETETCMNRIKWTKDNVFGDKDNKCALAYSKVQVECDVCRSCSIQDAGCGTPQGAGSLPFDCEAAINNFFRAWSPEKKHWCCTKQGKGCEGHSPPSVDAGYGMVWKHVQVNGYWTWVAVHGHGHFSMPYDCHAGLANWHTGWSVGKKVDTGSKLACKGTCPSTAWPLASELLSGIFVLVLGMAGVSNWRAGWSQPKKAAPLLALALPPYCPA